MKLLLFLLSVLILTGLPAAAQETVQQPVQTSAETTTPEQQPTQTQPVETQPAEEQPAEVAKVVEEQPKPRRRRFTELELSGNFGVDSKSFITRTRLDRQADAHPWFVRGGYRMTKSYTGKGESLRTRKVTVTTLDSQIKSSDDPKYYYAGATANIRTRDPAGDYSPKAGYFIPSVGIGRSPSPDFSVSLGAGIVQDYERERAKPAAIVALRKRHKITKTLSFDSNAFAISAVDEKIRLDSDITLSQQLNHFLFLRFGYSVTNMVKRRPADPEWDTMYRITLLWRLTH